jgi:hypothetical protein
VDPTFESLGIADRIAELVRTSAMRSRRA